MRSNAHNNFSPTELDPDLLSTSFEVQTNWHVITGAACTGKTTLIDLLAHKGFQTSPEIARQYFESEIAKGRTTNEILKNGLTLERSIADLQMRLEQGLQANEVIFLDRALPDSLTFYRVFGLDLNEILLKCFQHRYASVFILNRLPFQRSKTLGPEDEVTSNFLDEWLERDYCSLGYHVVRVPVLSPEERLTFVLERLSEQGL